MSSCRRKPLKEWGPELDDNDNDEDDDDKDDDEDVYSGDEKTEFTEHLRNWSSLHSRQEVEFKFES